MYLGTYGIMMEGIARLNPLFCSLPALGFVISVLGFAKLINMLFKKHMDFTYYAIFGLTTGSFLLFFPVLEQDGVMCCAICC
jgi:uncharacterized membrane protein